MPRSQKLVQLALLLYPPGVDHRHYLGGHGDGSRDHPGGGKGDRPQLTRMAASSRAKVADTSQDLPQLNGSEATPPMDAPAAHRRVSSCYCRYYTFVHTPEYMFVPVGACPAGILVIGD